MTLSKLTCPNCNSKENKSGDNFGYPPVCIGEMGVNATCYNCSSTFFIETKEIMVKRGKNGEAIWWPAKVKSDSK